MRKVLIALFMFGIIILSFAVKVETEDGNTNNYSVTTMKSIKGEIVMTFYYYDFDDGFEYVKMLKTKEFDDIEKVKIDGKGKTCWVYGIKADKKINKKIKLDFKKNVKKIRNK